MRCSFAGKSEVIDIINSAVLKGIKARLQSGDGLVTLEFTNEKDESGKGSKMDKKNNSKNKND